ncbi:hypothetical protein CDZ96_06245 [Mameliella alba]|nr:hypothetical protein CDZ96_06245 [Mameliella alba]
MFGAKAICDGRIALLSAVQPFSMTDVTIRPGSTGAGNEPGLNMDMPILAGRSDCCACAASWQS